MKRREEIGRHRWSAILRGVRAGLHDDLLPLYDSRGEIGIALWSQAYAHLCRFPGLDQESINIDTGGDSQSPINPSTKPMNKNTHKSMMLPEQQEALQQVANYSGASISKLARLAISAGLPRVRRAFGPSSQTQNKCIT